MPDRARAEANAALLPDIQIAPRERAWYFFRIGATYPTPFPGSQFPVDAFDQYTAQLVPNAEATLPGTGANSVQALGALLDKIGPAVVMVHSQSGAYGMDLVRARAAKMLGFINRGQLRAGDGGRSREGLFQGSAAVGVG